MTTTMHVPAIWRNQKEMYRLGTFGPHDEAMLRGKVWDPETNELMSPIQLQLARMKNQKELIRQGVKALALPVITEMATNQIE